MQPPVIESAAQQLLNYIATRFDRQEALIMATKQAIEQAFADQKDALTDYTSDVTARLADLSAKLDAAIANDSADAAALEEMKALTDDVVARTEAMTAAIAQADVAVQPPTA